MSFDRTTAAGWALGIGGGLLAGIAKLPPDFYPTVVTVLGALAAVCVTFGGIVLGMSSSEASKTPTLDQIVVAAKRKGPNATLTVQDFIDPGPPPEKKEAPDSSSL